MLCVVRYTVLISKSIALAVGNYCSDNPYRLPIQYEFNATTAKQKGHSNHCVVTGVALLQVDIRSFHS